MMSARVLAHVISSKAYFAFCSVEKLNFLQVTSANTQRALQVKSWFSLLTTT